MWHILSRTIHLFVRFVVFYYGTMLRTRTHYTYFSIVPLLNLLEMNFFRWAFRENNHFHIHRNELFLIHTQLGKVTSVTIIKTLISKIFLKFIWDCRNRYCLPSLESAKENLKATLNTIISVSIKMREHSNDSGLAHILWQE